MSDTRILTTEVAKAFLEARSLEELRRYDLNNYEEIESPAATVLATSRQRLRLNALKGLSSESAEALADHAGGSLELNGIATLSDPAALALASYKCPSHFFAPGLSLRGLTRIPATPGHLALVRLLSNHSSVLFLECLTSLEDDVAEVLASHTGPLQLDSLTTLSDKAAAALARHKGDLDLNGLVALSDSAVASLASHEGYLRLAGLVSLTDAAAAQLAKHNGTLSLGALEQLQETPGHSALARSLVVVGGQGVFRDDVTSVYLNGLKSLSTLMAKTLTKAKELELNGLTQLPDAVADVLSLHKGGGLSLDGVSMLSDNAVHSLSRHEGSLSLNGLASLTESACRSLASFAGDRLSLNGVLTLAPEATASLSRYTGQLSLWGLCDLSDEAAAALAQRKSRTDVNVAAISGSATRILRTITKPIAARYKSGKWPGVRMADSVVIDLTPMVVLDDDAAEVLAQCKESLMLNGLVSLSDKAAAALAKHSYSLCLSGVQDLSDKAIAALAKSKACLDLDGLSALTDKAAVALGKHKADSLSLKGVQHISIEGAEALAAHAGGCVLLVLGNLPDAVAALLRGNANVVDDV